MQPRFLCCLGVVWSALPELRNLDSYAVWVLRRGHCHVLWHRVPSQLQCRARVPQLMVLLCCATTTQPSPAYLQALGPLLSVGNATGGGVLAACPFMLHPHHKAMCAACILTITAVCFVAAVHCCVRSALVCAVCAHLARADLSAEPTERIPLFNGIAVSSCAVSGRERSQCC